MVNGWEKNPRFEHLGLEKKEKQGGTGGGGVGGEAEGVASWQATDLPVCQPNLSALEDQMRSITTTTLT